MEILSICSVHLHRPHHKSLHRHNYLCLCKMYFPRHLSLLHPLYLDPLRMEHSLLHLHH